MRIAMIGTGYVGLVSGACFADFGHRVCCVDKDSSKIEGLKGGVMPIWEPGLEAIVKANAERGRLTFATDLPAAVEGAEAVFIAVGTPARRGDGHADLSFVFDAVRELAKVIEPGTVVVTKSTVPVGTGDKIEAILKEEGVTGVSVVSNPEFLREGASGPSFSMPARAMAEAVFPRIPWRFCRPRKALASTSGSFARRSRSTTTARRRWSSGSSAPSAASRARPLESWGSRSSPTPTTCA